MWRANTTQYQLLSHSHVVQEEKNYQKGNFQIGRGDLTKTSNQNSFSTASELKTSIQWGYKKIKSMDFYWLWCEKRNLHRKQQNNPNASKAKILKRNYDYTHLTKRKVT